MKKAVYYRLEYRNAENLLACRFIRTVGGVFNYDYQIQFMKDAAGLTDDVNIQILSHIITPQDYRNFMHRKSK